MQRPTGVTILAVLSFIGAVLALLVALGSFFMGGMGLAGIGGQATGMGGTLAMLGAFAGVVMLILAALYLVVGFGLWKLRSWGRMLAIILVALGMLAALAGLVKSFMPLHVGVVVWELIVIAIDVWILWYFFRPHVKQAFGVV